MAAVKKPFLLTSVHNTSGLNLIWTREGRGWPTLNRSPNSKLINLPTSESLTHSQTESNKIYLRWRSGALELSFLKIWGIDLALKNSVGGCLWIKLFIIINQTRNTVIHRHLLTGLKIIRNICSLFTLKLQ